MHAVNSMLLGSRTHGRKSPTTVTAYKLARTRGVVSAPGCKGERRISVLVSPVGQYVDEVLVMGAYFRENR